MKRFHQQKISIKHQRCSSWKISTFHCNSGVTYTNKIGDLTGYSNPVWYNSKGIAKTLSLGLVQKHNTEHLTIKCKENHEANVCSMITIKKTLSIFHCCGFLPAIRLKIFCGKYQVEAFQKFNRVHILEVSTVIFFSDNEGTIAKMEYGCFNLTMRPFKD